MDNQHIDDAPRRDLSRQDATATDTDFTLSLEEVAERYARAGHARTLRSLQRYCASGHLDAQKIATTTGDKYLVTSQSVARHIAQIEEFAALEAVAPFRDASRPVATAVAPETPPAPQPIYSQREPAVAPDMSRQGATEPAPTGETSGYVTQLEHELAVAHTEVTQLKRQLEVANDDREFTHEQINRKDRTIEALIERDRETNVLVRGLQEMLTPLLGGGRRRDDPPTYTQ